MAVPRRAGASPASLPLLALLLVAMLPGCASLFLGGVETVLITSQPPGARVLVDGEELFTPVLLSVPRDSEPLVVFDGLPPVRVRRTFTSWLLIDGPLLLPLLVDGRLIRGDLEPDRLLLVGGRVLDEENGALLAGPESAP